MHPVERWMVNSFSELYLAWYVLPRLVALMETPLRGRGLAIGPGIGWETLALAEKFPEAAITGVDCDPDQVARARHNLVRRPALSTRISFEHGDATALDFPTGIFDFAYELNVLHHISDYGGAIREIRRVLKPGGRFFLQDLTHSFLPGLRRLFSRDRLFTPTELVRQLEEGGFDVDAKQGRAIIFVRARRR
jgi:ubiquinone/menaquinone biosynthesis C-methylase UbiE